MMVHRQEHLIAMDKSVRNENSVFWKSLKERALSKKVEEEEKKQQVPYLDKDCISNILIRLPLESLESCRFVCKLWYNTINSPTFIDAHFRRSKSVLIFLKQIQNGNLVPEKHNSFSVEASFTQSQLVPILWQPTLPRATKFSIQFIKFEDGKSEIGEYNVSCRGRIRATCNGLILLDNKLKKGGLIVMNPVTRKLLALPLGTIYPPYDESYGFAFTKATGEYTVVHLFRDELQHISCEILNVGTRMWRPVNGPSFGLLGWFGYPPVSAIRALHWIPQIDHSDYLVSLEIDKEIFHSVPLPKSCRTHDRILEMHGLLSLVVHEELNIEIWKLHSIGDTWAKHYSISSGCVIDMVPVFFQRITGDLMLKRDEDGSFYAYDFESREMRKVEMDRKFSGLSDAYLPHVNCLVSWRKIEVVSR